LAEILDKRLKRKSNQWFDEQLNYKYSEYAQ